MASVINMDELFRKKERTADDYNDEGILNLRNAIVIQAVHDMKAALRKGWFNDASAIKNWFRSDAFSIITYGEIDPEKVIAYCEKEVGIRRNKRTK